jgi:hypothetical protein
VVQKYYLKLKLQLKSAGFNADFYPYDWRQGIDQLGSEFAEVLKNNPGLQIVAHSMGGLVTRAALGHLEKEGLRSAVNRIVMLGTPNYGSFAPLMAYDGSLATIRMLGLLDVHHSVHDLIKNVFRGFAGLAHLMPHRDKYQRLDIYNPLTWPDVNTMPLREILKSTAAVHDGLHPGDDRFFMIAGVGRWTIGDMRTGPDGTFEFFGNNSGDGTVPLNLALLKDVNTTYYTTVEHGKMPTSKTVGRAVIDILTHGRTDWLPDHWDATRLSTQLIKFEKLEDERTRSHTRDTQFHELEISPAEFDDLARDFMSIEPSTAEQGSSGNLLPGLPAQGYSEEPIVIGRKRQQRLDLKLAFGSITEVDSRCIILGVFKDVAPTGPADALDRLLGGAISDFTRRRMFTGNAGEVFVLPTGRHRITAEFVIFAGLGSFDEFDTESLKLAAENVARTLSKVRILEFATVMVGAGSGMALSESIRSMIDGFIVGIQDSDDSKASRSVTFCEMDKGRFARMRSEVMHLAASPLMDEIELTVEASELPTPQYSIPADYRRRRQSKDLLYLIIKANMAFDEDLAAASREIIESFTVSLLTPGGKATVITDTIDANETIRGEIHELLSGTLNGTNIVELGGKIASFVLPDSIRTILQSREYSKCPVTLIHDAPSSKLPFEAMQLPAVGGISEWKPAIINGLTRRYSAQQMSVAKWLDRRDPGRRIEVLLVVNPTGDLPGAEAEGKRIRDIINSTRRCRLTELNGENATRRSLLQEFTSGKYDVLHYAGHAYFNKDTPSKSGILCAHNEVLSGEDLAGLGSLPTLVFFNACESARLRKRDGQSVVVSEYIERHYSLAEAFLRGGVGHLLGTFWPVGDVTAEDFARKFYSSLIDRKASFSESLLEARKHIHENHPSSPDWADYILFGDDGGLFD